MIIGRSFLVNNEKEPKYMALLGSFMRFRISTMSKAQAGKLYNDRNSSQKRRDGRKIAITAGRIVSGRRGKAKSKMA